MTREDADRVADWLYQKAQELDYAELTVNVRLHKGNPTLVERGVVEKEKLSTGTPGGRHEATHRSN